MSVINAVLRAVFDALLFPFRSLPALVGLTLVSLVVAIGMLLAFKATSNQAAIESVKRKIHAGLFEIRLFNDDLRLILIALKDILRHNLSYLRHSLVPMFFVLPPLVLIMAQLQFHYAYAGMDPQDTTLLEVTLAEDWETGGKVPLTTSGLKPDVQLELPEGVRAETPSVWAPSEGSLTWRIALEAEGDHEIGIRIGDETISKELKTGDILVRRSPVRPSRSFLDQLIYPGEAPVPKSSVVESIELALPAASVSVFGWQLGEMAGVPAWMIVFFVLSMVFAFALRKPMGVEI